MLLLLLLTTLLAVSGSITLTGNRGRAWPATAAAVMIRKAENQAKAKAVTGNRARKYRTKPA